MGELQTLLKELPFPYIIITITVITILLRGVNSLLSSNVEKIFFSMEKNILIRFSHIIIISIVLSILFMPIIGYLFTWPDTINLSDLIVFYLVCFTYTFPITFIIYHLILPDYLGNYAYFIEHENHGRLYIIKSMNKKEILLYTHPRLTKGSNEPDKDFSVVLLKEDIKKRVIYRENYTATSKSFKKFLKPIMFFKNR
ncbi:hypothetical protein COL10_24025 [Bacillus cereus]|uniref:hypothetical protein n=1 Tax=Bacillus cereus TaxID=1396 RepID=UPI000BF84D38|nr:hypothetical protein [Bacillus cereus]PFV05730.1 hypothetical protein COL10_24025 [Bacillus cereus]PGV41530.1 hypothetical protein COD74_22480 [Bacillus cereus]